MIGTGSHRVVVKSQWIPASWTMSPRHPPIDGVGPMAVAGSNGLWPIATSVSATVLGISRRALDAATDLVKVKRSDPDAPVYAENAFVQRHLLLAEGSWQASRAGVEQALEVMWREANAEQRLTPATRWTTRCKCLRRTSLGRDRRSHM